MCAGEQITAHGAGEYKCWFVFDGFRYDRLIDAANYARWYRQPDPKTL